jgi:hypothetical protein
MPDFRTPEALRYGPSSADSRTSAGHRHPTVADTDAEPVNSWGQVDYFKFALAKKCS